MPPPGYFPQAAAASPGYDPAQKQYCQVVKTDADIEAIRKAMKGMGCDGDLLLGTITNPKYRNPWAMAQLAKDYNTRFMRDLLKDVESETRGILELGLIALVRGPLATDVDALRKALIGLGTDEEALMDVLLNRSNADLRAISEEYKRSVGRELLADIKDDVDQPMHRLYSVVLSGTRAEDFAPVIPQEVDRKVSELQHATEGMKGANAIAVAQVLASSSNAQIRAIVDAYQRKYQRNLEDIIKEEFKGDMKNALLRIMSNGMDPILADAERVRASLLSKDKRLVYRLTAIYWDQARFNAVKEGYKKRFGKPLTVEAKDRLSGDFEKLVLALVL